jgi:hypothetical protein
MWYAVFTALLLNVLTGPLRAQAITYTHAEYAGAPLEYAAKLDQFFTDHGYSAVADLQHGVPSLGINQIYLKDEGQFVMVKYGLQGSFPMRQLIPTPEGFLFHDRTGSTNFFLYFRGFNEHAVRWLMAQLQAKITTYTLPKLRNLFIADAQASPDCGSPALAAQMTDFSRLTASMVWDFGKNCVSGLGTGAWEATGGMVSRGISNLWSAVQDPIGTVDRVGRTVHGFTVGLARFMRGLITDPQGTMARIGANVGAAWTGMTAVVSAMSTDMKVQFICSLIGALGIDAAIIFFTAGAGSARLAATLAALAARFSLVARTMGALARMSASARAGLGVTSEKMKNFMNRLMAGNVPDADLRHLDELTSADRNLSLRTLACYM